MYLNEERTRHLLEMGYYKRQAFICKVYFLYFVVLLPFLMFISCCMLLMQTQHFFQMFTFIHSEQFRQHYSFPCETFATSV